MKAFITGSHAYGRVKPSSDFDLVIRVDAITAEKIRRAAGLKADNEPTAVRFGKLNLILCETDTEYASWQLGTTALVRLKQGGKPQNRDEAKCLLDQLRQMVGIPDKGDSR